MGILNIFCSDILQFLIISALNVASFFNSQFLVSPFFYI